MASFVLLFISGWWPLKKQGIGGGHNYSDLKSVQHAATCFKVIGRAVFHSTNNCSYQYGEFLLRFLNWTRLANTSGLLLGGIFFVLAASLIVILGALNTKSFTSGLTALALILSTGPWLLFERGNFDLLIFLILFLAICATNSRTSPLALVLVAMTTLMKFYTWPLLLIHFVIEKKRSARTFAFILSIVTIPLMLRDIASATGHPNPLFAAFGLPAPGLWINFFAWRFKIPLILSVPSTYLVGGVLIFLASYLAYFSRLRERILFTPIKSRISNSWQRSIFVFSTTVYLSCYLAGMNYDYRLIYLIVSLVIVNATNVEAAKSKLFIGIEIAALWLTYFFFGCTGAIPVLLALVGNICQLYLAVFLGRMLYLEILGSKSKLKFQSLA
jgi:hypothetical protein